MSNYPLSKISFYYKNGSKKTLSQATSSSDVTEYAYSYESDGYHLVATDPTKYTTAFKKQTYVSPFKAFWLQIKSNDIDKVVLNP